MFQKAESNRSNTQKNKKTELFCGGKKGHFDAWKS